MYVDVNQAAIDDVPLGNSFWELKTTDEIRLLVKKKLMGLRREI